jgi:predicted regulator of Ras-like GTPase activity (Roadblock/LC7/MglB family)
MEEMTSSEEDRFRQVFQATAAEPADLATDDVADIVREVSRRRQRRAWGAALGAGVVGVAVGSVVVAVGAERQHGTDDVVSDPVASSMVTASEVADRLEPLADLPEFGQIVVDGDHGIVTIYWAGPAPRQVEQAVEEAAAGTGIATDVRRAAYSEVEFRAASRAVGDTAQGLGIALTATYPDDGMQRLVVELDRRVDVLSAGARERLRSATDVPIELRDGAGAISR